MTAAELYDIERRITLSDDLEGLSLLLREREGEFYEFVNTTDCLKIVKRIAVAMMREAGPYFSFIYPRLIDANIDIYNPKYKEEEARLIRLRKMAENKKWKELEYAFYNWLIIVIERYPEATEWYNSLQTRDSVINFIEEYVPWISELDKINIILILYRIGYITHSPNKKSVKSGRGSGRKPDKFSDCIMYKHRKDTQRIIDLMREELVNKRGKAAVEVIYAVMQLGYIRKPTQAEFCNEFGELIERKYYGEVVTNMEEDTIKSYVVSEDMKRRLMI